MDAGAVVGSAVMRVSGRSTRVEVRGEAGAALRVEGADVSYRPDGSIDIAPRSSKVRIVCSEQATVMVSTSSGSVDVHGQIAQVKVITSSGSVGIERTVDADVRTSSGRIRIDSCVNSCRVVTKSGTVTVGEARAVDVSAASSGVELHGVTNAVVQTISGKVSVVGTADARIRASTMSGPISIALPAGSVAVSSLRSRSGRVQNDVPVGDGASVEVATTSGSIRVSFR